MYSPEQVIILRQKVGVSVSEAQLSMAMRQFIRTLDAELVATPHPPPPINTALPSSSSSCDDGAEGVEARRAALAARYLSWRRQRLAGVREWCEALRCGIDAEGPTWWADCT
jgi:hypothetical protein